MPRTMEVDVPSEFFVAFTQHASPEQRYVEGQSGVRIHMPLHASSSNTQSSTATIELAGDMIQGHMASVIIENIVEGRRLPKPILMKDYDAARKMRDSPEGWGAQNTVQMMEKLKNQVTAQPNTYYQDPKTGRFGAPVAEANPSTPGAARTPNQRSDDKKAIPEGAFRGMEMLFPAKHVGLGLVGKGGSLISSISKRSGCDVQVIRDSRTQILDNRLAIHDVPLKTVEFCGTADQQIDACVLVGECSMKVCGEAILCVPKLCTPMLVGKGGSGIRQMEVDNGECSIQIRDTSHGMGAVMVKNGDWQGAVRSIFRNCDNIMNSEAATRGRY